ncbi:MAG: recombinase RecT [Prevotella sp.]|nr:recombinase RecT [Prevotella sp.]
MAENQLQVQGQNTTALSAQQQRVMGFKNILDGSFAKAQLEQVLKENAGSFAVSLMEVYTNDKQLQACDPKAVFQEAVKAASLKLPLNKQLGYGYLVVYNNWDKVNRVAVPTPTFVLGYRGYIQLAQRTGFYKNINAGVVYEGELRSKDKLTGAIDISGEAISDKVIGYFAYFELLNGCTHTLYMTTEQMANFALKYAATYKPRKNYTPPTIGQLLEMAQSQASNGPTQGKVGWDGDYNAMATKTVLRHLLSKWGLLSIEMMNALDADERIDNYSAEVIRDEDNANDKPTYNATQILDAEVVETKPEDEAAPI